MPGLRELQRRMRNALLDEVSGEFAWDILNDGLTITQRIAIYRNNVFSNLREALRTLFPVTERLVGAEFFNYLTEEFIRRYPSPAGDLNCFGADLGRFISTFSPAAGLPYLADVADLEWRAHTVYHARDCAGLDCTRLSAVDPEDYDRLHFHPHPATALFDSVYPVHRIWQVNQPAYTGDQVVDLDSGAVRLLIERRGGGVELQTLSPGTWALLNAMTNHADFARAGELALQAEPSLDLGHCLSDLIAQSTLVDFSLQPVAPVAQDTITHEVHHDAT